MTASSRLNELGTVKTLARPWTSLALMLACLCVVPIAGCKEKRTCKYTKQSVYQKCDSIFDGLCKKWRDCGLQQSQSQCKADFKYAGNDCDNAVCIVDERYKDCQQALRRLTCDDITHPSWTLPKACKAVVEVE
ncbi:MAG: hypothetical protein FWD57_10415 [Polyangiaceae bacterium]|nr:hypothetical protein [Polyangiaceae bacterium]